MHGIESFGRLVQRLEVPHVLHAVVLQRVAQVAEVYAVGLEGLRLENQVEEQHVNVGGPGHRRLEDLSGALKITTVGEEHCGQLFQFCFIFEAEELDDVPLGFLSPCSLVREFKGAIVNLRMLRHRVDWAFLVHFDGLSGKGV